jgi:hypothetical protein
MTAAERFLANPPANLRDFGLVMTADACAALVKAQDDAGITRHRVAPVALVDGRYAVNADVLSEAHPGGLFIAPLIADADAAEVLPWPDVLALLPAPADDDT